jgi:hypothetical protein
VSNDTDQLIEQVFLGSSERRLVGDLEEIPDDLRALAVQPAIRQSHLLQTRQHSADLFRQHEPR